MTFLNKTFKNRVTGDIVTIIDVYQNVAITSNKEKINTDLLLNEKLFIPVNKDYNNTSRESFNKNLIDDVVDPNRFFSNQNTYNAFAEKIKQIPLDNIPEDNLDVSLPDNYSNLPVSTNESAIIMSDPEDEIEELKRKYGATSVDDSLMRQNEAFSKILNEEENIEKVEVQRKDLNLNEQRVISSNVDYNTSIDPIEKHSEIIQRFEVQKEDPIISMFKNVKRNLDFNIDFKVTGKIPRLDFIEMMEDSYEMSIIGYLADEFTQNLLRDPNLIREEIISKIKKMIEDKNDKKSENNLVDKDKVEDFINDKSLKKERKKTINRKPKIKADNPSEPLKDKEEEPKKIESVS